MRLPTTENTRHISLNQKQLAIWLVKQLLGNNPNPFENIVYKEGNKYWGMIVFKIKHRNYEQVYTLTYGSTFKLTSYDKILFIINRNMLVSLYYNDVELTDDIIFRLFLTANWSEKRSNYTVVEEYDELKVIEIPMLDLVKKVYPNVGKYNVYSNHNNIIISALCSHPITELYITRKLLKKLTDG